MTSSSASGGSGWSAPPPPPPGGGRKRLLLVALLGVIVVVALVAVVGVIVFRGHGDDTASSTASDSASDSPTNPTSSTTAPTTPTTPPASSTPPSPKPTHKPTPKDTTPPAPTGPVSYQDFAKDWNFRLGSVHLHATYRDGWDYDSCGPVENSGALTALGCRRASQMTFRGQKQHLAMTQIILTMGSAKAATSAVDKSLITASAWKADPSGFLVSNGRWRMGNVGPYVVITLVTHTLPVRPGVADDYLRYGNGDWTGALAFR